MHTRLSKMKAILIKDRKHKEAEDRVNQLEHETRMVRFGMAVDENAMLILKSESASGCNALSDASHEKGIENGVFRIFWLKDIVF